MGQSRIKIFKVSFMLLSKSTQLIVLFGFLVVNLYLLFAYENDLTFIFVYGGYVVFLVGLLILSIVFFMSIKYDLEALYYTAYFLTVGLLVLCLAFTLNKPFNKFFEKGREARYEFEHSGGRGVFKSQLETEAAVAIVNQDTTSLKRCLKKGLDANAVGKEGPFLFFAVRNNAALAVFRILLSHGADPNAKDKSDNSLAAVLNSTYPSRRNEILRLLLNYEMEIPEDWFFFEDELLDAFFEKGVSINQKAKVSYYESSYKGKRVTWSPDYKVRSEAFSNLVLLRNAEWTPMMILATDIWLHKAEKFMLEVPMCSIKTKTESIYYTYSKVKK
jgi:hypothetical protein